MTKARAIVKNKDVQLQLVFGMAFLYFRRKAFFLKKNEVFWIENKTWHGNWYNISVSEKTKKRLSGKSNML